MPSLACETRPASPYGLGALRLFPLFRDTLRFGEYVHRGVHIPVVFRPAFRTGPLADTEVFGTRPQMSAGGACLGRRVVPSAPDDFGSVLAGAPFQNLHKLRKPIVVDLASPEPRHTLNVKVFYGYDAVP